MGSLLKTGPSAVCAFALELLNLFYWIECKD